jgi:hypothetical protein
VDPDLSEFSYGFALTSELVARHGLKRAGAPHFATQLAEAKPGGGWDMKLPALPVYLQFKRSDRMVRNTASHADKFPRLPFFRMHLRKRSQSKQHQLLLDLETRGGHVFYCAPGFTTSEELSDAYIRDLVTQRSLFVKPSSIGPLADNKSHHIAFQLPSPAFFCSEPISIERIDLDAFIAQTLHPRAAVAAEQSPEEFFIDVARQLLEIYESHEKLSPARRQALRMLQQRREPAEYAGLIARTLFDVDLLVLPRSDA